MKKMLAVGICVCFISGVASAVTVRGIDLEFVTIGNPGNAGDTRGGGLANPYGCGSVDYDYRIGKYEITNSQWNAFATAAGAPKGNPSDAYDSSAYWTGTNVPTNNVSWYEAAQFCNWLTSGDKSKGAYLFSGTNANPGAFQGINRSSAQSQYGTIYVIPTEDEWYKAAYYTGSGYSMYANGTDTAPIAGTDTNYNRAIASPWNVGTGTQEQNGTYDMMGNVCEWNETQIDSYRGIRGGSYYCLGDYYLASSYRYDHHPIGENVDFGFRVASVPEPASLLLLGLGGVVCGVVLRRRKR